MRNNRIILIIFPVLMMLSFFIAFASAQEADTRNMSNEEIMSMMMTMIQQMQQTNTEPADDPTPIPAPTVTEIPQTETLSNEEILMQMYLMLQQMQQGSMGNVPEPTATPLPTATPQPEASSGNDEILMQMYLMLQQMQQGNSGSPADPFPPASEQVSVWKNKKLIVEGLPGYMFIQPVQPEIPGPDGGETPGGDPGKSRSCTGRPGLCYDGTYEWLEQCVCDVYGNCHWECVDG